MIFDTISHLSQYLPSGVWKDLAPFISQLRPDISVGKHWIREPEIFAQVSSYQTKLPHEGRFETHEQYVDIQILLAGTEIIDIAPRDSLVPDTEYDEQNDIRFYKAADVPVVRLTMLPDSFALFFPQDSHCPQLTTPTGVQDVKNVVLKIHCDLFMT
jgi:YhcH/YjgK/YiaL family protein